jgi:hypothetical protein
MFLHVAALRRGLLVAGDPGNGDAGPERLGRVSAQTPLEGTMAGSPSAECRTTQQLVVPSPVRGLYSRVRDAFV